MFRFHRGTPFLHRTPPIEYFSSWIVASASPYSDTRVCNFPLPWVASACIIVRLPGCCKRGSAQQSRYVVAGRSQKKIEIHKNKQYRLTSSVPTCTALDRGQTLCSPLIVLLRYHRPPSNALRGSRCKCFHPCSCLRGDSSGGVFARLWRRTFFAALRQCSRPLDALVPFWRYLSNMHAVLRGTCSLQSRPWYSMPCSRKIASEVPIRFVVLRLHNARNLAVVSLIFAVQIARALLKVK